MQPTSFTPSHDGTFGIYLNNVKHNQQLSDEQINELLTRYKQQGDIDARNKVVESHLLYVITLAKPFQTDGLDFLDLIQEGNLGLIEAAERFNPEQGIPFIFFAYYWIRKYISHFVARYRTIIVNSRRCKNRPTLVSLDAPLGPDDNYTLEDTLADPDDEMAEQENTDAICYVITQALKTLDHREEQIVRYSFGIGCHPEQDDTIAEKLDYSSERVRQIRDQALRKLYNRINLNA